MKTRLRLVSALCLSFCIPSFLLGGWMVFDPNGFWSMMGFGSGDEFVRGIYGGAIVGEGAIMALGVRRPARYLMILQYLMVYKTVACVAAMLALSRMAEAPVGGYLVIGGWVVAGLGAAMVYPWGRAEAFFKAVYSD